MDDLLNHAMVLMTLLRLNLFVALPKRALSLYQQGQIDVGVADANIMDMHLKMILENVKLLYLFERERMWDASQNWEDILSLGEQHRLGMARLFFHKPQFGILDECTNATSVDVEEHLYRLALNMGITVITSSQVANLVGFVIGPSGISWLKSVFLQTEGLPTLFGLLVTFYVGTKAARDVGALREAKEKLEK
ncbi:hypothetical protein Lser_V15G30416 [Lactuca serriola]